MSIGLGLAEFVLPIGCVTRASLGGLWTYGWPGVCAVEHIAPLPALGFIGLGIAIVALTSRARPSLSPRMRDVVTGSLVALIGFGIAGTVALLRGRPTGRLPLVIVALTCVVIAGGVVWRRVAANRGT